MKLDPRMAIGALFIVGYYATVWVIGFHDMPPANASLVKDAMLQLGPPVGAIIYALFRTDRLDEQRAENTGKMADAVVAAANATPGVTDASAANAAGAVADAAADKADEIAERNPRP